MENLLDFCRGPLFVITFLFMVLGLIRQFYLQVAQLKDALRRLSYNDFSFMKNFKLFVEWMLPVGHMYRNKPFMSVSSFIFHIGILVVPVFFAGHIVLWQKSTGLSWPGIPMWSADILTITTIICVVFLLVSRVGDKSTRALSTGFDYMLLVLITIPFLSGFMAVHPNLNPVSYNAIMLIHVLSSELVFVMMPYSKLVHAVLFPFDRVSSDIFWKMPVGAGEKVAQELHGMEAKV